jgi:protoporphyrinogen oxidase
MQVVLPNGLGALFEALASGRLALNTGAGTAGLTASRSDSASALDIRYNSTVRSVRFSHESRAWTLTSSAATWEVDYVICTLPLGVLQVFRVEG